MSYSEKLLFVKKAYPFERWNKSLQYGLSQYTKENCDFFERIFDELIQNLITAGPDATEEEKIAVFKIAIEKTNYDKYGLIETGERENLCELTNKITIACGLVPENYGHGEGLASVWREW
jgi:hypothetical protein